MLADVDGTLVTQEKILTQRGQAAVRALRIAGIRFAITSGQPPRGMTMLIAALALTHPSQVSTEVCLQSLISQSSKKRHCLAISPGTRFTFCAVTVSMRGYIGE